MPPKICPPLPQLINLMKATNNGRADDSTLVHDTQPSPPTQRICICDQPSRSDDELIQCSYICSETGPCPKQFHKRCLINHGYRPPYDIHPYFCMKCSTKSNPPDTDDTDADEYADSSFKSLDLLHSEWGTIYSLNLGRVKTSTYNNLI